GTLRRQQPPDGPGPRPLFPASRAEGPGRGRPGRRRPGGRGRTCLPARTRRRPLNAFPWPPRRGTPRPMIFKVEHRIGVQASAERIWDHIADLSAWHQWNPVETEVEGAIAYGGRIAFNETIPGLPERRVEVRVAEWSPSAQLVWTERRGLW